MLNTSLYLFKALNLTKHAFYSYLKYLNQLFMFKNVLASSLLIISTMNLSAQIDTLNIREKRPFGLHLNVMGATFFGSVGIDYFVSRKLSLEAGVGPLGFYFGGKYHLGKRHWKAMPYVGLGNGTIIFRGDDGGVFSRFYIPCGYQYTSRLGLDLSVEAEIYLNEGFSPVWPQLRIGYRFNKRNRKDKK